MKILTCITTYNRLEYTKRCIESWLETTKHSARSHGLVIVDNASTDGTREYLEGFVSRGNPAIFNERNLFPGAATNIGWHDGIKSDERPNDYWNGPYTHLHRSDNDIEYLPGWAERVKRAFAIETNLGQLGLLNMHEDYPNGPPLERLPSILGLYVGPTGGNCVIPRSLWDEGLRWEAGPWQPGGNDEDTRMSQAIAARGMVVGRLVETVANNMSFHRFDDQPAYYRESAALRGLVAETSV